MKNALAILTVLGGSMSLAACVGDINGGGLATGAAGVSGAAGTGVSAGVAGTGVSTGAAGAGNPATGAAGAAGAGTGAAGTGTGAAGIGAGSGTCGASVIPADVAALISARCVACHGNPPLKDVPASLTTYAQLTAPSMTDPTKSVAALAAARMQDAAKPMPPAPLSRATTAEIAVMQSWASAGAPSATCPDGGVAPDGGGIVDPYATPPICTSKTTWTGGNKESPSMNPGMACVDCHTMMNRGPKLTIGGTIFPTAHEPDLCNGGQATTGARVIVTGANGQSVTLTPNPSGNFQYEGALATPYTVKVTYMGRERAMVAKQTSGDCNTCHTQAGAMMAPGRIMLP